jgi:hypothetical protein
MERRYWTRQFPSLDDVALKQASSRLNTRSHHLQGSWCLLPLAVLGLGSEALRLTQKWLTWSLRAVAMEGASYYSCECRTWFGVAAGRIRWGEAQGRVSRRSFDSKALSALVEMSRAAPLCACANAVCAALAARVCIFARWAWAVASRYVPCDCE